MRRALASLVVLVMTFALVSRGVAAPLMHLHPDMPAPAAPVSVSHPGHDHVDCDETEMSDAAATEDRVVAHTHAGHAKDKSPPIKHGKVCDANAACCGPLALSEASDGVFRVEGLLEPWQTALSAGVKPTNPDRPPSLLLA